MFKRTVSSLLAVLLIVSLFTIVPLTASAEDTLTDGDYSYVVVTDESGETPVSYAEITGYTGEDAEIMIPDTLGGLSVTAIRREAFRNNDSLTSVTFPDTVTFIADYSFADCDSLAEVSLPSGLEDLARASFYNCQSLEEITLPATITKCYANSGTWMTFRGPFNGCTSLSTFSFEDGFSVIPDYLFEGCTGITSMNIPNTVTSIGESAFKGCSNLASVEIPTSVKTIGGSAFSKCSALTEITLPEGITTVESNTFEDCSVLEEVNFPTTLTAINGYAFQRCGALKSVSLPANLTTLGQAFYNCENLETVNIPKSLAAEGSSVYKPFSGCSSLNDITFENGITAVPAYLFSDCAGLTSITIPSTAASIGAYAFYDCSSLETVTMHDDITTIGKSAFYTCESLTDVTLPKNLATLDESAFGECDSLESIEIPASLTSAGDSTYGPFYNCENLKTVTFAAGRTALPARLFARCTGIEELTIPEGVTSIGDNLFYGYPVEMQLTTVNLPSTLESIGSNAFAYCGALESITIPASVTSIGENAFWNCSALETVTVENGVAALSNYAFRDCTALTTVTLPESLSIIGSYTFSGCKVLSAIELPSELTEIGSGAFSGCEALENVSIPDGVSVLKSYTFSNCYMIDTFEVGTGITKLENNVFSDCYPMVFVCKADDIETIDNQAFGDAPLDTVFYGKHSAANLREFVEGQECNYYCTDNHSGLTWSWSDDYSSAALTIACECGYEDEVSDAVITSEITTDAGCTEDGVRTYTATAECDGNTYTDTKTEAIAHKGHSYSKPEWKWSGYTSAYADFTCAECSDVQSVEANLSSEVTEEPSCTKTGVRVHTAKATFGDKEYSDTNNEIIPEKGHSYGAPEWKWTGYTAAEATFTCAEGDDVQKLDATITSAVTKVADDDNDGVRTYTAKVTFNGKEYTNNKEEVIPANGHNYGAPEWKWNGYKSAAAEFPCESCSDVQRRDAVVSSEVTKEATCTEDGVRTYTAKATFNGKDYTDTKKEVIPKTGHKYGGTNWKWSGYESASSSFKCADCGDIQTVNAEITSEITRNATCTVNGVRTYTAKLSFNGREYISYKTQTIPKTGHSYGDASWKWSGLTSASASFKCANCGNVQTVNAEITSEVTKDSTCTEEGVRTYTAKAAFSGKDYTDTKTEAIPKKAHNCGDAEWKWSGLDSANASFTCADCGDVQTVNAKITSAVTKNATCTEKGVRTYTAKATFDGKEYESTKTEPIPAKGHSYAEKPTWKWSGYKTAKATFKCGDCGDSQTVKAAITSKVTKKATAAEEGKRVYTAKVTFEGKTYTNKKNETLAKLKTTVTFPKSTYTMTALGNKLVTADVENGKGATVYTSSDTSVAKVSSIGMVSALVSGTVTITATNNGVSATVKVSVKKKPNKINVSIDTTRTRVSANTLKSKDVSIQKIIKVSNKRGKLSYVKRAGSDRIKINATSGVVTIRKGTHEGTYNISVKITDAGNAVYKKQVKSVNIKFTIQ